MNKEFKMGVKTFTLPAEDRSLSHFLNKDGIVVTSREKYPCPKEGVVLYVIEYEDYTDNNDSYENEDEDMNSAF